MWQEARKHEKHIRSVLVDYRKRAERRLNFYTQIRQDPVKFLRIYGTSAKINLDLEVRKAAQNPKNMMPWTGDPSIIIDRFDVRANLETYSSKKSSEVKLSVEEKIEERLCNYERYRCLAHNDFLEVTEEMALKQIEREEKYGDVMSKKHDDESKDKKSQEPKAAIGFVYDQGDVIQGKSGGGGAKKADSDSESNVSDVDSDADIDVELDLEALEPEERDKLIEVSHAYGMKHSDFIRLLDADQILETELRAAKIQEEEKNQHLRRPRRSRHLRMRRPFDKYSASPFGPKAGLLNGQPITRRKVYLSGASSDSESYGSPSEDEERQERSSARRRGAKMTAEQLARTKPALFETKRPAVLVGGLTFVAFCDPKKRRRRFKDRPRRRGRSMSRSSTSPSSSSDSDRREHRGHRNRSSKRSKVEYITTFGSGDDDDDDANTDGVERREFPLSTLTTGATGNRPGETAFKLASSVVSSMFKKSTAELTDKVSTGTTIRSSQRSTATRRRSSSRSSRSRERRYHRRRSSDSSVESTRRRQRRRSSSRSPPRNVSGRRRSSSSGRRVSEAVPIKRYYRRELESDEEKKLDFSSDSSSSDDHRRSPGGGTGDSVSGGKRANSPSSSSITNTTDRYSSNASHSYPSHSSSSKDTRVPLSKVLGSGSGPKLTPREIMRRRMQAQLNKTMNADKKAEMERLEKQERERLDREEGLRRQAAVMRQREMERRLAERGLRRHGGAPGGSRSPSGSRSCSPASPPPLPPALRERAASPSTRDLDLSYGAVTRARLRKSPSPFRRRDYENRYGTGRHARR